MPALAAKNITTHNNAAKNFGSTNAPPVDKLKLAVAVNANIIIAAKVARRLMPIRKSFRKIATTGLKRELNNFIANINLCAVVSRQQNNFIELSGLNRLEKFIAPRVVKISSRFVE